MTMRARGLAVLATLALGFGGAAQGADAADAAPRGARNLLTGSWEFVSNVGTDEAGRDQHGRGR
jgi:hypothetical protein